MFNSKLIDITNYKKLQKIGSGSFGEVYSIEDKSTGHIFAAKISFRSIDMSSIQEKINITREIKISSSLNHPSILKYIGYSQSDFNNEEKPVILMEYLKNGSLSNVIHSKKLFQTNNILNDTKKLIIIYGIASGMKYLHSHEIIHRDLNPKNILVDDNFFPKISDFGLSKIVHDENSMTFQSDGSLKGTLIYISPEIYKHLNYSKSGDVYAFAFILYEILTREVPNLGSGQYEIISNVIKGQRPNIENKKIPDAYRLLIEKCWAQNPDERPSFDSIVRMLKADQGFITENVNRQEFIDYIDFVDKYESTFDIKEPINIIDIDINQLDDELSTDLDENTENVDQHIYMDLFITSNEDNENYINELNQKYKQLIENSLNDNQKQFLFGMNMIEGKNEFKQNIITGVKYLEKSFLEGNIESAIYLYDLIKKSDLLIQQNVAIDKTEFDQLSNDLFKKVYKNCLKMFDEDLSSTINVYQILDDFHLKFGIKKIDWFGTKIQKFEIKSTGQLVAFKMPQKDDLKEIKLLIDEYKLLCKHYHPSIAEPIGLYHPNGTNRFSMITAFQNQGNLSNFLNSKKHGTMTKMIILLGIALGIDYLHQNSLAFYDLKPENVLITDKNYPLLINIVQSKEKLIEKSKNINDCLFFAPEIINNEEFDEKVDIYSFGLIANYIFSNKKPFDNLTLEDIRRIKSNETIEIDKSIKGKLNKIIKSCLDPNPSKRPTFETIISTIKNQYGSDSSISSYLQEIDVLIQKPHFFRIPRQIINLPSKLCHWNLYTGDPINWDEFESIFNPNDDKKVILIMTIGNHQSGKSTFLRTITGNNAYYSGTGMSSTTLGLLVDGPYTKNELTANIFDDEFRESFDDININDQTKIYFIDSQGIGDDFYENISVVLDRIHSIFCSISTICVSIININETNQNLHSVLKIMRKSQYISGSFSKMFFLVKNYETFELIADYDFVSLSDFHEEFLSEYKNKQMSISKYYISDNIKPIPL